MAWGAGWEKLNELARHESVLPAAVDLGPVRMTVESGSVVGELGIVGERLLNDGEIMSEIADHMVGFIRSSIESGTYLALSEATLRRRRYPFNPSRGYGTRGAVGSAQPLVASGALRAGITARSRPGYAAARRGKEWYGFLHDRGVGRVDERHWMQMMTSAQEWIAAVYDEWVGRQVEGDGQ